MKLSKENLLIIISFIVIIPLLTTLNSCPLAPTETSEVTEETTREIAESLQEEKIFFQYPFIDYPIGKQTDDGLYWDCSDNDFGDYLGTWGGKVYNGFHSGEDWNLKGGKDGNVDLGKKVYAIGEGKVVKISKLIGNSGWLVAIKHEGSFIIPDHEKGWYKREEVDTVYSVYEHIDNLDEFKVTLYQDVNENTPLGRIMDPGGGPHLHFEIRLDDEQKNNWSADWSLVDYNRDGGYQKKNAYFIDLQKMIDAGLRDPSEFIEANLKISITVPEEHEQIEPEIEKKTATKEEREIESEKGNLIPPGFVTIQDDNWAIALLALSGLETISSDMKSEYDMLWGDKIFATFAIIKLSPVGEGPTGGPPFYFHVDLLLIDDRGEEHRPKLRYTSLTGCYHGESLNYYPLDQLPKGFTYTISVPTGAPILALGHIQKIMIDDQEVTPIKFNLGELGDLEGVISFGEEFKVSKWLTLKPVRATSPPSDEWHPEPRIQLEIEVRNSSYSERRMYTLTVGAQMPDGTITNSYSGPGYSAVDIPGNTSVILSRTILGITPPVRAYLLLAASETGPEYFWIIRPE